MVCSQCLLALRFLGAGRQLPCARGRNGAALQFRNRFGRLAMHDLGADSSGVAIGNKWENKGQFIAWFKYYVRPLHYEFLEAWFHKREQQCMPNINTCSPDPGYPCQYYNSALPTCPLPAGFILAGTTT